MVYLLAAMGVLALVALRRPKAAPPKQKPVGADQRNEKQAMDELVKTANDASKALAENGPIAGAAVVVNEALKGEAAAATSLLGGGVQGNVASALLRINPFGDFTTAPAIVAGAIAGRQVDILLGGDGSGVRGYTAMALGGVVGAVFACAGTVLGYCALYVAAVIYALVAWVDAEVHRVATLNGQALRDYEKDWQDIHDKLTEQLKANDPQAFPSHIERFAACFADGFMLQKNRNAYNSAMHRAYGIGATKKSHADYWHGYGLFIGVVDAAGNLDDSSLRRHARDAAHVAAYVPASERVSLNPPPYPGLSTGYGFEGYFTQEQWDAAYPKWKDVREELIAGVGATFANASAYSGWMQQTWGIGQSETSHGAWGRNSGYFEGYFQDVMVTGFRFNAAKGVKKTIVSGKGGLLSFNGHRMYWRDEAGDVGPFIEVGT